MKSLIAILILSVMFSSPARAQDQVSNSLISVIKELDFLFDSGVHIHDKPRIYMIRKTTHFAFDRYQSKPASLKTYFSLYNMYLRFDKSSQFFKFIRTRFNEKSIDKLHFEFNRIATEMELDGTPFSKVIATTLTDMLNQITALIKIQNIDGQLRDDLRGLVAPLGTAIAIANQGDNKPTFDEAESIYHQVQDIYGELEVLNSSQHLHVFYMEIVGLNEFVKDFIQF